MIYKEISKTELISISKIKSNPNNPRILKDEKFKKLCKSLKEFPEMLNIRPIVIDEQSVILGGNMRLKACKENKIKKIPCIVFTKELAEWNNKKRVASGEKPLSYEDQCNEFIIKDNVGYGQWDWDILANEWDSKQLEDWGLDVWQNEQELDYSILEEEDLSDELDKMTGGVKKAIMIEFDIENYDKAYNLVKFWRENDADVGLMLMEKLEHEKNRIKTS